MAIWIIQPGLSKEKTLEPSADFVPLQLLGWPDLTHIDANMLKTLVSRQYPDEPPERIPFYFDPAWAFINDIHIEDIIALLQPGQEEVYMYEVTGGYRYETAAPPHLQHRRPAKLIKKIPIEVFAERNLLPQSAGIRVKQLHDADTAKFLNAKLSIGPARKLRVIQWLVIGMMVINLLVIVFGNFRDAHIIK